MENTLGQLKKSSQLDSRVNCKTFSSCFCVISVFSSLYVFCLVAASHPFTGFPFCPSSPEPPGSSLCHRELFCPSAQCIGQQQSVFFWSQRPPPLPAGSTKTWSHRQPAPGHHWPHEGKCVCVCVCCLVYFVYEQYQVSWTTCVADCLTQSVHLIDST